MRLILCRWIVLICVIAANCSAGAADPARDEQFARIDQAIAAGTNFLVKQQADDGAWRSTTYGLLKDGTSLTPLAVWAISDESESRADRERALKWMSNWFVSDGRQARLSIDVQYPVYAAGLCLPVLHQHHYVDLSKPEIDARLAQILAWTDRIRSLQLSSENGWLSDDVQYGGWGYSHEPPRKPEASGELSPLDEPNLSATVFALEGLYASDRTDPSVLGERQAALRFVSRCQNLRMMEFPDPRFNDGGFHFMRLDPVRNKPGVAGIDSRGETRFVSYGSATADGLRALLLCGVEPTDPRVVAAKGWLLKHFGDGSHPGAYPSERSSLKRSLDFYYAASVARAFQLSPVHDNEALGRAEWAMRLSQRLISRQREDGAWSNPSVDVREDDPLVATPLALRSLHVCRDELRREATRNP